MRYFNPVGAHELGLIGENPIVNTTIYPRITKVAIGNLENIKIFGADQTKDGTCIRDYIHVMDLAEGHLSALNYLLESVFADFNFKSWDRERDERIRAYKNLLKG